MTDRARQRTYLRHQRCWILSIQQQKRLEFDIRYSFTVSSGAAVVFADSGEKLSCITVNPERTVGGTEHPSSTKLEGKGTTTARNLNVSTGFGQLEQLGQVGLRVVHVEDVCHVGSLR